MDDSFLMKELIRIEKSLDFTSLKSDWNEINEKKRQLANYIEKFSDGDSGNIDIIDYSMINEGVRLLEDELLALNYIREAVLTNDSFLIDKINLCLLGMKDNVFCKPFHMLQSIYDVYCDSMFHKFYEKIRNNTNENNFYRDNKIFTGNIFLDDDCLSDYEKRIYRQLVNIAFYYQVDRIRREMLHITKYIEIMIEKMEFSSEAGSVAKS